MSTQKELALVSFWDYEREISVSNYADLIVYEEMSHALVAMRFGGYTETVKSMNDAIWGGGAVDVSVEDESFRLYSTAKAFQRQLKKDRYYTECFIIKKDDVSKLQDSDPERSGNDAPQFRQYIFTAAGDRDQLFTEIDRKTSIPLIPDFRDYVIDSLFAAGALVKLCVYSINCELDGYCLVLDRNETELKEIIETGLRERKISIPRAEIDHSGRFNAIDGVVDYLNEYGIIIAEKIKGSFKPLFDPSLESVSGKIELADDYLYKNKHIRLYPAQKAVAESVKRKLDTGKAAMIIAECGSGKTKIAIISLFSHQKEKSFNVVMAPGHLTHKWVREIEETLPDTVGRIIRSITDLYDVQREFRKSDKSIYAVISKERARDSYARKPAVIYVSRKKVFVCPHCYKPVMMELSQDGSKYLVEADQFYFTNESSKNHKCQECGEVLWSAVNPDDRRLSSNRWVKVTGIGFVYRELVHEHIAACSAPDITKDLIELRDNPDEYFPIPCAYKRFGLSRFIRKKIKKISAAVFDEVHMYKGNTGVGNAMAELIKSARKVVAMTATLINGYSSGIFYILYRLVPGLMLTDGREYENPRPFNTEYGVVENTYEMKDDPYNVTSRSRKVKKRERMLPGVSPLVFTRFLLENSAFLSLADMTASMPEYEEIPVALEMKDEVASEYRSIENTLKRIMKTEKSLSRKILARYLDILSIYPDMPYGHGDILSPEDGSVLLSPQDTGEPGEVYEKDLKVLEIVRKKTAKGGRVLIYTNWVKSDTQDKLLNLLRSEGFKIEVLSVSVAPEKREEWVSKQVESGIQCLISNPALVETGCASVRTQIAA